MNLAEIVTEFQSRGFDYLSTTRAENYANDAYLIDICEQEDWPFLDATTSGAAPLTISDLRTLESVIDSTQAVKLKPLDRRHLTDDWNTDLSTPGTPTFYYLTSGSIVNVFPANTTDTLAVRYWKVPERLTSGDTPLLPSRFHSLIVDAAVARAYEDSDDYELAQNAWANFQNRLQAMRDALLEQQHDGPDDFVVITDREAWA